MSARFATDRLRHTDEVSDWSEAADVIIVGLGSASACATLETHRAGATVLVLEKQSEGGGTSARAAGQFYLGGNTSGDAGTRSEGMNPLCPYVANLDESLSDLASEGIECKWRAPDLSLAFLNTTAVGGLTFALAEGRSATR
jgi:glycine/D-amino acid oxidase-like deaminating enzyme